MVESNTITQKVDVEKMYYKYFLSALISMIAYSIFNISDGIFIAQSLGDIGLSAVNIAWPLVGGFVIAIGQGIGIISSIYISNLRGKSKVLKKDSEKIKEIKASAIVLLIIIALILTPIMYYFRENIAYLLGARGEAFKPVCDYIEYQIICIVLFLLGEGIYPILRNSFKFKEATMIYTAGCISNLILDFVLVTLLNKGMLGAAIGTISSEVIMTFVGLYIVFQDKEEKLKLKHFKINFKVYKDIFKAAIAPIGLLAVDDLTVIFFIRAALKYGGIPAQAMYGAVDYLRTIFATLYLALSEGVQPLMSMANGEKNEKLKSRLVTKSLKMIVLISIFVGIGLVISRCYLKEIYNLSNEAMKYANMAILSRIIAMPIYGLVKFFVSYNEASLNIKLANFLVYLEALIVMPVLSLVIPNIFEINGVWFAYPLGELIIVLIAFIFYFKYRRNF